MKLLTTTILCHLLVSYGVLYAQKHDNIWLFGAYGGPQASDSSGLSIFDFSSEINAKITGHKTYTANFSGANSSMCDSTGKLLFYTNGEHIYNAAHKVMDNGNKIAEIVSGLGSRVLQATMILSYPEHWQQYVLLSVEAHPQAVYGWKLFCHIIDMKANNGLGKVVDKRHLLVADTLTWGGLAATKHANGRDWWFMIVKNRSSKYYLGSVRSSGVSVELKDNIAKFPRGHQSIFSPDGTKYIKADHDNLLVVSTVNIYDFDRCSGKLSNWRQHSLYNPKHFAIGACVSPDSRYLYIFDDRVAYQYDLQAPDIFATETVVAEWDGSLFLNFWPTDFFMGQMGPDGRMYVNTSNSSRSMHRIHFPTRKAGEIKFVQNDIKMPTIFQYEMPNHPNYRLGPLDGSPCDTLGLDNHPVANFRWELEDTLRPLQVTFTDLSYYEPQSWVWDFGDGSAVSTERYPLHEYSKKGNYRVCLTVKNQNSSNTMCRWVNLGVTGVEEVDNEGVVRVWPNPVRDVAWLDLAPGLAPARLRLHDVTGRPLLNQSLMVGLNRLDMSGLSAGIYFYEVVFGFGSETTVVGKTKNHLISVYLGYEKSRCTCYRTLRSDTSNGI